MIRTLMLALFLWLPLIATAEENFEAGTHYALVTPALPGAEQGKATVVEFFWYGCPHCFKFEPTLQAWLKNKPDYVEFERIPAIFNNPKWQLHAQAFYTAELLGVLDKVHQPLFDAIHVQHKRMDTREAIRELFESYGVDGKEFEATFDSFAVQSKVNRAADLTRRYGVDGVPAMAVNGKYRTGGGMAGSYENLIRIVDFLAKKEAAAPAVAKKEGAAN